MSEIIREADALIAEMDSVGKLDDDIFVSFFEREEELQERLDEQKKEAESYRKLKEQVHVLRLEPPSIEILTDNVHVLLVSQNLLQQ